RAGGEGRADRLAGLRGGCRTRSVRRADAGPRSVAGFPGDEQVSSDELVEDPLDVTSDLCLVDVERLGQPTQQLPGRDPRFLSDLRPHRRSTALERVRRRRRNRKSTRLNSSHVKISYAVFCMKKKNWGSLYNS